MKFRQGNEGIDIKQIWLKDGSFYADEAVRLANRILVELKLTIRLYAYDFTPGVDWD